MVPSLTRGRLTRSSDAGEFLELFLIGAAVSAVGVRWLLALTGYPRVGGGGLHVAHMLWGGLLMVVAIIALLLFLDRRVQQIAAGIGGIGFGVFIDEIGKFLTADNDYFFRPAIALIYIIFIGLFLLLRVVLSGPRLDPRESLANAMDLLEDGLDGTIGEGTRAQATLLLRQSADSALTRSLAGYAAGLADRPPVFSWARRAARRLDAMYDAVVENPFFERAVVLTVGLYAAGSVITVGLLIASQGESLTNSATGGQALSTFAGSLLVLRGIPDLAVSRVAAYRWFRRGVLVWILVAQVFVFYTSQLAGIGGLIADLVAYGVIRYMFAREIARAARPQAR